MNAPSTTLPRIDHKQTTECLLAALRTLSTTLDHATGGLPVHHEIEEVAKWVEYARKAAERAERGAL